MCTILLYAGIIIFKVLNYLFSLIQVFSINKLQSFVWAVHIEASLSTCGDAEPNTFRLSPDVVMLQEVVFNTFIYINNMCGKDYNIFDPHKAGTF